MNANLEKFIYTFPIDINKIISNYSDEDKLLCMIGSFTEQKNHMYMLDVMKELPSNYKLILLGDGKLKDKIVEKINVDNLSERVVMLGFRNNIAPIVKASDLVVIPSKWEGFGLVAAEAMACGKQIVCNDVDGLSEVVGDVGVKVNINNKNEFKDAISNDLNTSSMLTVVYDVLKDESLTDFSKLYLIEDFDKVLSLDLIEEEKTVDEDIEALIQKKIEERNEAKKNKNYELADKIRNELFDQGIRLIDDRNGTKYEII